MASATIPRPPLLDQRRLMLGLLETPERALDELATFGPVCALGAGPLRMVVVSSPGLVRDVLLQPNDRFRYDVPLSPFPTVVGKSSMLCSDGDAHARRRGAISGSLTRRSLARWIPMIVERTDTAVDGLLDEHPSARDGDGALVDLEPVGRRLVLDIVVRALFGAHLADRLDEIDELERAGHDYLASPLWRQRSPLPSGRRARAHARRDRDALDDIVDEAIATVRGSEAEDTADVLTQLVTDGVLSDEEIRDQVKTLIGAGYDTTASTLAWAFWETTLCPGLWDELRREADEHLGTGAADEAALTALRRAAATVKEVLRLHPASGIAVRTTADVLAVGEYEIRRNTLVLWSPYLTGRDAEVWDDALRFDPARFLADERSADSDDASARVRRSAANEAWLPFGRGARMCVGFALAQMELTLILARLAQRLDLEPTSAAPPQPRGLVVSSPEGGAPMRVVARAAAGTV